MNKLRHSVSDNYTVELYTEITTTCWCNLYAYSRTFRQHSDSSWKETCGNVLYEWKHSLLCGVWGYARCQLTTATGRPSLFINYFAFNNTALRTWSTLGYAWFGRRRSSKPWNTLLSVSAAAPGRQLCWNHQTAGTRPDKDRRGLPPPHKVCKYEANNEIKWQIANCFIFTFFSPKVHLC